MPAENPTIPIPNYLPTKTLQAQFDGGIAAVAAPHNLKPNEVAASTNVDHTLEWGAAACRRGSKVIGVLSGIANVVVSAIGRLYGTGDASPWLAVGSSIGGGAMYALEGTLVGGTVTLTTIGGSATVGSQAFVIASNTTGYVAYGNDGERFDGTNSFSWILPAPGFPPVATANTVNQTNTGFNGTLTATVSGTVVSAAGSPYILTTGSTGAGTSLIMWAPTVTTNWEFPTAYAHTADLTGLGGTSTYTVGVYGVDYALIATDHPELLQTVSIDLSIGDTSFNNYWHRDITPGQSLNSAPDPYSLLLDAQLNTEISNIPQTVIGVQKILLPRPNKSGGWEPARYKPVFAPSPSAVFAFPIPRTDWQMIGTLANPGFTNIAGVRYTFITSSPDGSLVAGAVITLGNQICCLSDMSNGISYFYTFAQVAGGNIVAESAPSPPSYQSVSGHFSRHGFVGGTVGPLFLQNAAAQVVLRGQPALGSNNAITHAVVYRQGGLLQDAYMVGSASIGTATITLTDVGAPDLLVLENPALSRNVYNGGLPVGGGNFLGTNFTAVSEPFQSRVFAGLGNTLVWSAPGQPTKFQSDVATPVSNQGDSIQAFSVWDRLLIVNQNSVYEFYGTIFEGGQQNWTLNRTGARRGSAAPKTAIKTPHGVLLFGFDGLSTYYPGYGADTQLTWVNEKIGDLWRGTGISDPAFQKGNRIPAINPTAISAACAAYGDNKIYLAVPTGTNTLCDTMFVLDVQHQIVAGMYQYPFQIGSLFWDYISNRLVAGVSGGLQLLETGLNDSNVPINWLVTTKDWTTPTDLLLENLQAEGKALGGIILSANVDSNGTQTLGTLTNFVKAWTPLSIAGTIGDRVSFTGSGTQSSSQQEITQLQWDFIPQTPKVTFFKTDVIPTPSENYAKTWLALLDNLGTATVTATLLADGVAVTLTNGGTSTALTAVNAFVGKKWQTISLPNITTAKTLQAIYSSTTPFKYYQTEFEYEPKPFDKTTWLVTYKKAGGATQADLARFFAMDIEGPALATLTSTWIIDGTAFATNTLIFGNTDAGEKFNVVRNYMDQIPFPPGGRGYLFQQQITSANPFKVWRASLDIERIGIKGLSRVTMNGTPQEGPRETRV